MTFSKVLAIPKGTKIGSYIVKGPGTSRGEPALVYLIRNKKGGKSNEKRIRQSEWKAAHLYLRAHSSFPLSAFSKTMPDAAKDGECNYLFTRGVFEFLGLTSRKTNRTTVSAASPKKTPLLAPELVPVPLWGRSAYRMLGSRGIWKKKIRPDALAHANNRCSLCGSNGDRLICHDKWQYDDSRAIATLIGFEIHCANCDAVTHAGNAYRLGPQDEIMGLILSHLSTVNQCSVEEAVKLLSSALSRWEQRSKKNWTVKVDAVLVKKYPELAGLPDFVPPQIGL